MITAQFDGAERRFTIDRANVPYLESSLGGSLYAILKRFTDGQWSFREVAAIVSFALHGPSADDRLVIRSHLQALRMGMSLSAIGTTTQYFGHAYRPHPAVVSVMERDGHGNYAALAADILTDVIFGEKPEAANDAAA